ncbi:MAG: L-2-amino-thiazoline-4-carboxylic acid hydrolase [Acidimicrobiia bacterium]|nr:L-2-amino-thiazoline-4-carboxylic acid hydrolase [Acidimicrobiia bacterium]
MPFRFDDVVMVAKESERLPMTVRWFVQLGIRKLDRWIRQSSAPGGSFRTKARSRFRTLAGCALWPRSPVLRWHLAGYLLPGVALYQGLREAGWPTEQAAGAVGSALESDTQPRRQRFERYGRRRGFFTAFAIMIRPLTRLVYPSPGWQVEWLETSRHRIAFDITGCFYLDTLTHLGAQELTPVYCRVDDILYDGVSPELTWRRTTMLATGGERCDFRFERLRREDQALL